MESKRGNLAREAVRAFGRGMRRVGEMLFPHQCVGCGKEGKITCDDCNDSMNARMKGVFSCPGCGDISPWGSICMRCESGKKTHLDGLISGGVYSDRVARSLLHLHKFEGVVEAGRDVRRVFRDFIRIRRNIIRTIAMDAVVIPVPMHPIRQALRGFNQCDALAEVVAEQGGRMPDDSILIRDRIGMRQSELDHVQERLLNVSESFRSRQRIDGGKVVLVDDVYTTGATLSECARILKDAGAKTVWGVTLLRG